MRRFALKEISGVDGRCAVRARVVIMKRRDAETEADAFNAPGNGPMHDKLRARFDNWLRGNPNLSPEQCFALAWGSLTLAQQAKCAWRSPASVSDSKRKMRGFAKHLYAPMGAAKGNKQ